MKKACIYLISVIMVLLICPALYGDETIDGRYLGMAGSNTATAEGMEYLGGNPATLAAEKSFGFELLLISARVRMNNNSLSMKEYDDYFTTGDELSGGEIDHLLGHIPDSGLRIDGFAGVRAISFCAGPLGFGVTGTGNGFATLPREALEFPFYGNKEIKELRFDQLKGEGWSGIALNLGGAKVLSGKPGKGSPFLSAGVNLKYIFGLAYAGIVEAGGGIETTEQYILANGNMHLRTSEGGSGYAADAGMYARVSDGWSLSLHCNNLVGDINWDKDNQMSVYQFNSDSLSILGGEEADISDQDTTYSTEDFSTGLPRSINLAAAYRANSRLVLTASWRQGLDDNLGNTVIPRFALGAEYAPLYYLPLRMGIALGGNDTFATGLGMGIRLGCWRMDLGYLNHSFDWFRNARGVDLAVTSHLRF